ncbi:MAG: quinone oxidoreductase [Gemmatimonadales bacterium]
MRAIVVREFGDPEVLRLESVPSPSLGEGQVLVEVAYAGVNFTDTERRRGLSDKQLPWTPGIEAAGTVMAVGQDVSATLVGRRVAVAGPHAEQSGTYATNVAVSVARIYPIPDELSFETAAAVTSQGLTAYHLVHTAGSVRAGQTVLVHAAAGGVGQLAVQLARRAGARVLGATSRAAKMAVISAMGAEPVVLDVEGRWVDTVRRATGGKGVDLVLDSVGAPTQAGSLASLAPLGHLVHYGSAGGAPQPVDPEALYDLSLKVSSYWLWTPHGEQRMAEAARAIFGLAIAGDLRAQIDAVYPLDQASEAHRRLESGASTGKLLLRMDQEV